MKIKLIFIVLFLLLVGNLKSQNTEAVHYKNSISVDVGGFVMANYHRQIIRKNWYALQGQVGIGAYDESKSEIELLGAINVNAYINNVFCFHKHKAIIGFGGQSVIYDKELMGKIGYQYDVFKRFSVGFTIYHWVWASWSFENQGQEGPSRIKMQSWIWEDHYYHPLYSFGINYYF